MTHDELNKIMTQWVIDSTSSGEFDFEVLEDKLLALIEREKLLARLETHESVIKNLYLYFEATMLFRKVFSYSSGRITELKQKLGELNEK